MEQNIENEIKYENRRKKKWNLKIKSDKMLRFCGLTNNSIDLMHIFLFCFFYGHCEECTIAAQAKHVGQE